jgi:hypothetical protein
MGGLFYKLKNINMKKLADGFEVSARSYYYLLDWNEINEWKYMAQEFGKSRLMDLTRVEYKRLFNKATTSEMNGW